MDPCGRNDGTYLNSVLVSQMAMLQIHLQHTCNTFWRGLAKHGTKTLNARASANMLYACAKLVSHHLLAPPQTGMSLQAESALQVLRDDRLHDVLLEAAEREAPSMNSQEVANTVWALAGLGMPPTGSLHDALWIATEREAPSMNSQAVAITVRALAKLNMPPAGSLRDALWTAVERMAPSMNSQDAAETV
jgi:hypothetical protein